MLSRSSDVFAAPIIINGKLEWPDRRIEVRNPARPDEVVGTVAHCSIDDTERALNAAKNAQREWRRGSFGDRAKALAKALNATEERAEERAVLYVRENGKTLRETRREIASVSARGRLTLALAEQLDAPRVLPAPAGKTAVRERPYGVVSAIVPWNAPVPLASMQIIPALLTGNTVVVKVPDSCPFALTQTVELLASALPAGVLNLVSGSAREIGGTLTMHPNVDRIAFVGSVDSARKIIADAGQNLRGVVAELGGNDAAIVLDDMILSDASMDRMAGAIFRMAGQVCMAIKRIYAPESMRAEFLSALGAAMDRIRVGNGLARDVTMGSLHNKSGLENAVRLIADAKNRGATITQHGTVDDQQTFDEGYFIRPTMITDVGDDAPIVVEEQFAPVIPVMFYNDIDDAVARANKSIFGLGGSVWGRDIERASEVAWRIEAGTVFVNTHGTESVNRSVPYGGIKQSGNGRRSGLEGLREYLETQTLTTYEMD